MCENPDDGVLCMAAASRRPPHDLQDWQPNGRLIGDKTGAQTHGPISREVWVWNGAYMVPVAIGDESIKVG